MHLLSLPRLAIYPSSFHHCTPPFVSFLECLRVAQLLRFAPSRTLFSRFSTFRLLSSSLPLFYHSLCCSGVHRSVCVRVSRWWWRIAPEPLDSLVSDCMYVWIRSLPLLVLTLSRCVVLSLPLLFCCSLLFSCWSCSSSSRSVSFISAFWSLLSPLCFHPLPSLCLCVRVRVRVLFLTFRLVALPKKKKN